jgi:hypothetical protein
VQTPATIIAAFDQTIAAFGTCPPPPPPTCYHSLGGECPAGSVFVANAMHVTCASVAATGRCAESACCTPSTVRRCKQRGMLDSWLSRSAGPVGAVPIVVLGNRGVHALAVGRQPGRPKVPPLQQPRSVGQLPHRPPVPLRPCRLG